MSCHPLHLDDSTNKLGLNYAHDYLHYLGPLPYRAFCGQLHLNHFSVGANPAIDPGGLDRDASGSLPSGQGDFSVVWWRSGQSHPGCEAGPAMQEEAEGEELRGR